MLIFLFLTSICPAMHIYKWLAAMPSLNTMQSEPHIHRIAAFFIGKTWRKEKRQPFDK